MSAEEFEQYRQNAKKILGYMPIKTPCVTCQTPDAEIPKTAKLPNKKCLIRRCVDTAGVKNCAYCARFPCDTLKATAGAWNRETIEAKLGAPVSEEEYHSFVEPFEGMKRLSAIRASLKPEEIVEPAKVSASKTGVTAFPENLAFSKEDTAAFKAVHRLLAKVAGSSLGLEGTDTLAQRQKLETLKAHVLRFLWIIGNYAESQKGQSLVDAETYIANRGGEKSLAIWTFVEGVVFKALSEFGVCCERVVSEGVAAKDLTTGTGYLRRKGWVMQVSFEENVGGAAALKALQTYTRRLDREYGAKAFRRFQNADMQLLLET